MSSQLILMLQLKNIQCSRKAGNSITNQKGRGPYHVQYFETDLTLYVFLVPLDTQF